nr:transposase [uncultured Blautia sp.]
MQDSLRFLTLENLDYLELKELGRFRQKLVKQRTRLKIQLTSYITMILRKQRDVRITIPLDTVPANLSGSSGRCSLTT